MSIQNGDGYEVDFDLLDFQSSVSEVSFEEPIPDLVIKPSSPFKDRKTSRTKRVPAVTVEGYKAVLHELQSKIAEICRDNSLSSELKSDLIKYASRQSGHQLSDNRIVQVLLEQHSRNKYGSNLILINAEQGSQWFEHGESHIIEDFITKGELNIIGGLSGAAKTNFTAMFLSALLNPESDPRFLGYRVNRDQVNQVFFIGLDGGRNVYAPIFRNTGLIDKHGALLPRFNFIPNESGWGISSSNLDKLETRLKEYPNSIVVVDSLLAAISSSGVDENSPMMAARIMDLKLVCEKHNATPIVLAHQKKESTQDFTGADSLRGHGSIPAFAGQIITLNFLDQKSKVNGKAIPDRKSPKRRLVAGHRGTPIDLLVELDFDNGTVKSHGEFYDALFSIEAQSDLDDVFDSTTIQSVVTSLSAGKRAVFDALSSYEAPTSQATLVADHSLNKGTVSKSLGVLKEERFQGTPLITEIQADGSKLYEVAYTIKQKLREDY